MGLVIVMGLGISSIFALAALAMILDHIETTGKKPWED